MLRMIALPGVKYEITYMIEGCWLGSRSLLLWLICAHNTGSFDKLGVLFD